MQIFTLEVKKDTKAVQQWDLNSLTGAKVAVGEGWRVVIQTTDYPSGKLAINIEPIACMFSSCSLIFISFYCLC